MKKYILNLIPFIGTAGCMIAFNIIGSEVLPDGRLVEPFYLIPIAFMLLFIGIIGLLIRIVLFCLRNKKANI